MINVTHDEPFQFRANTFHHALGNGSGLDVASDSPSHGSYASLRDNNDRHLYSPTGSGRGRKADRRQKRHHSPLVPAQRAPGVRRNINGSGGSGTGSSDTRRRGGAQRNISGASKAAQGHGNGNGNGNGNAKASRSSSRDGSFRSGYSSYSYDPAYDDDDDGYRGYGEYDEDSFDPEEEAHIRRLRGPKLNAHILPLPTRQIELEEEEERHRREDAEFAQGDEGETTPVQEHTSMSMTPKPQIPKNITAEPLSQEDHDAVGGLVFDDLYSNPKGYLCLDCCSRRRLVEGVGRWSTHHRTP